MKTFVQNTLVRILNTENKQNIAKNSGWLFLDHAMRIFFGFFIGAWVARYLGPGDYGKLSYIVALVGLLSPLYLLGLDVTVPKELIHREKEREEILGTTFSLKLAGSILIFVLAPIIAVIVNPGDKTILVLAALVGLSYIFKAFETLDIWFLNKLESKYTVIARNSGLIISGLFRIALILGGFSLIYFGFAITLEALIIAIALGFIFFKKEALFDLRKLKFDFKKSYHLLKISWIFVILGFFNTALLNIDKIMIENMLGSHELGLYSIASTISFSFVFLVTNIMKSTYPVMVKIEKDKSFEAYAADFQNLLNYMALLAYGIIFVAFIGADFIIPFVWGKEYAFSTEILLIQIFSILFIFSGHCASRWIVMNNMVKYLIISRFFAFISNIILNYFFIKAFGIIGAAYAMTITFFIVYILSGLFYSELREVTKMQLKAFFLVDSLRFFLKR